VDTRVVHMASGAGVRGSAVHAGVLRPDAMPGPRRAAFTLAHDGQVGCATRAVPVSPVTKAAEAALEKLIIEMRSDRLEVESLDIQPEPESADPLVAGQPARLKIVVCATALRAKGG
jgi:hypothetical protein